jgi:hypothetical protein
MNSIVVYESQFGNTLRIAEAIASVLHDYGPVTLLADDKAALTDFEGMDLVAVGGPTQRHTVPAALHALLESLPEGSLVGTASLAFDTRFHMPSMFTGSAASVASEGPLVDGEVERAAEWARTALSRLVLNMAPAIPSSA